MPNACTVPSRKITILSTTDRMFNLWVMTTTVVPVAFNR